MGHSTSSGADNRRAIGEELRRTLTQAAESARASGEQGARRASEERTRANRERAIERGKIESLGNGQWQMDLPGTGGGQILDETGSSRDSMYGRGGKVYSVRAWNADYNEVGSETISGSLNDAKRRLREMLHSHYGTRG